MSKLRPDIMHPEELQAQLVQSRNALTDGGSVPGSRHGTGNPEPNPQCLMQDPTAFVETYRSNVRVAGNIESYRLDTVVIRSFPASHLRNGFVVGRD